jgi:hypothetical protein
VTLFVPGAVDTDPHGMTGNNAIERSTYNNGIPEIDGNRAQANNYTLDGIDVNEGQNNLIAYNPAPDAIQEIKVISANAPAEYGNVNGGEVISVLKSGTNQFHGSAYGFLENQNLDANTWGNNHNIPIITINPYTQTIFGGTVGGPIRHEKLFFFADYEGIRSHSGGLQHASVIPDAMRNGDFSVLLRPSALYSPIQLYDSQNNFAPYVNSKVPVINPILSFLNAHSGLYPLPNATPTDGLTQNNYQGPIRKFVVNNQGDIKLDYSLRTADTIAGFYAQSDAYDEQTAVLAISFPSQNVYPTKLGGATWVHVFSPAVVNEARIGFTRVRWDNGVPTDPTEVFGLTGNKQIGIPFGAQQYVGFAAQIISASINATFNGTSISTIGNSANVQVLRDNTFSYGDNLARQRGRHLLGMGVQAIRYQQNYLNAGNYGGTGNLYYTGQFTQNPNFSAAQGYGIADFVLDYVNQATIGIPGGLVGNRQWRAAGFFQDDWKIRPNVTLNLGIRYEYDQPWYEVNNKTANVLLETGTVLYAGAIPASAPSGTEHCRNRACYQPNYAQIMKAALEDNGWTPTSRIWVLADGADGLSNLVNTAAEETTHRVLDWFHISMRLRPIEQMSPGS